MPPGELRAVRQPRRAPGVPAAGGCCDPPARTPAHGLGVSRCPLSRSLAVPVRWVQSPWGSRDGAVGVRGQSGAWPGRACSHTALHTPPDTGELQGPSPLPLVWCCCGGCCVGLGQPRALPGHRQAEVRRRAVT